MAYTFAGGIRLGRNRKARQAMIEKIATPKTVCLRIGTIGGEPFVPAVKPGDAVLVGEPIAMPENAATAQGAAGSADMTTADAVGSTDMAAANAAETVGTAGAANANTAGTIRGETADGTDAANAFNTADAAGGVRAVFDAEAHGTARGADRSIPAPNTAADDNAVDGTSPAQTEDGPGEDGAPPDGDGREASPKRGVYASIAGTVTAVKEDEKGYVVTIRRSKEQKDHPDIKPYPLPLQKISQKDLIRHIRNYAISGRDGLTAKKLEAALKGEIRHFIVDLTDPEPSLTAAYRLTAENTEAVLGGIKILLMATGIRRADIAVESDKRALCRRIREEQGSSMFRIVAVQPKFPQADVRELISAVYGTALGADKDPTKEGYVVFRASECADVYELFAYGTPPIRRVVSVSGDCLKETRNLLLPVGTSYADVAAALGGFIKSPARITENGSLRGRAVDAEGFIGRSTYALVFSSADAPAVETARQSACIRCGRCVYACPARITPYRIAAAVTKKQYAAAKRMGAEACLQCGACTYICPASIPLAALVREAKRKKGAEPGAKKARTHKKIR